MAASSPYEILSGPIEVYIAAVGVAEPDIADASVTGYTLVGTSGSKNYTEDGVTIRHSNTVETDAFRMLGTTGPRKASRPSEDLEIEITVADLKMAQVAIAMNGLAHAVTTTAAGSGTGGNKNIPLLRGMTVGQMALLLRGTSQSAEAAAVGDSYNAQFWVPQVVQVGEPEEVWQKSGPVALQMIFRALENASTGFGKMRMQHATAL